MFTMPRNEALAFIAGSSLVSTFVSLAYIGRAHHNVAHTTIAHYEVVAVMIPLLYGAFAVLSTVLQKRMHASSRYTPILVGAALGLLLSSIGRFGIDAPRTMFGFTRETEWSVHVYAALLYAAIFSVVVQPVTTYVLSGGKKVRFRM